MIHPNDLWKQAIEFQKLVFDNTLNAMTQLQTWTEKTMALFMDQTSWFAEKCQDAANNRTETCQEGCDMLKKKMEKLCG